MIFSGSAPMQPVTMTLPFSAIASPMAREQLRLRAVEKAAGVDDGEVGALVLARELIALRAQPRDDALGIDQRLGAAERDEGNAGGADIQGSFGQFGALGEPTADVNHIKSDCFAASAEK